LSIKKYYMAVRFRLQSLALLFCSPMVVYSSTVGGFFYCRAYEHLTDEVPLILESFPFLGNILNIILSKKTDTKKIEKKENYLCMIIQEI